LPGKKVPDFSGKKIFISDFFPKKKIPDLSEKKFRFFAQKISSQFFRKKVSRFFWKKVFDLLERN
jgi:hypothetical protein